MTYIEPVQLSISTSSENLSPSLGDNSLSVPNWPDSYDWAFNKLISDNFDLISINQIQEEYEDLLDEVFEEVDSVDEGIGRRAKQYLKASLERGPAERILVLSDSEVVVFTSDSTGLLFLVSDTQGSVDDILQSFNGKLSSFSSIASDFGLDVELLYGKEFAELMSESLDSEIEGREDFDNEFEETIFDEVSNEVTRSIDGNVTLKFGEDDPEIFEYDMLLHVTPTKRMVIEVKDESHEEADLGKTKLIDRPRDKTNIIGSDNREHSPPFRDNEKTRTFVIVKEMEAAKLEQHRQKAERRDINLLQYNGGEYLSEIEESFKNLSYLEVT